MGGSPQAARILPSVHEPSARGVADQLGRVVDAELLHQPRAVVLRRLRLDAEDGGDLLGGLSLGDEVEDLPLAWRERAVGVVGQALRTLLTAELSAALNILW